MSADKKDIRVTASVRLFFHSDQPRKPGASGHMGALCKGTAALLEGIRDLGSLNKATKSLGMDYSKSLARLHEAEQELGFKLYIRRPSRQGSALTRRGARLLDDYLSLCEECEKLVDARMAEYSENYRRDHRRREDLS
jgi:molybdate transport repressor ModE-like protein